MLIGAHLPPQGATARAIATADALDASVLLWLAMDTNGPHQPHDAARYPNAVHFVRLPNPGLQEAAGAYADRVQPIIVLWRGTLPDAYYVIGNEPEHEAGWPMDAWLTTLPLFAALLRADFGGIKLAATPFLVDNAGSMTQRVAQQFDAVCAHTYWGFEAPANVSDPRWGRNYLPLLAYGKDLYVTEVNASPANKTPASSDDWHERNRQIAQWIGQADADGVTGCCIYLADGEGEWAGYDVGPDAAAEILALIPRPAPDPPSPPEPQPMNPYTYDGDYAYATFTRMVAGALSQKNPSVVSRENYLAVHAAARQENISVATLLGWIVAENVDPDLIAVNNLAGIYYVGQSRATPGPLGPANEGSKPYCAFATLIDFWVTLAINIMTIDPDAWARGDLRSIARTYTGGTQGYAKVDIVDALRDAARFPHGTLEDAPAPSSGVTGEQIAAEALTQLNHVRSGDYDTRNGDHPWYLWCESFVERVHEHCGLTVAAAISAADQGRAMEAAGRLHRGDPNAPRGAVHFWDEGFWADGGHTAISLGDGTFVGTVSPEGVGIRSGWQGRAGYMGWAFYPGVGEAIAPADEWETAPMVGDGFSDDEILRIWYGTNKPTATAKKNFPYNHDFGIETAYRDLANGAFNQPGQDLRGKSIVLGRCISKEEPDAGTPGRSVRYYEAGKITALKQAAGSYVFRVN